MLSPSRGPTLAALAAAIATSAAGAQGPSLAVASPHVARIGADTIVRRPAVGRLVLGGALGAATGLGTGLIAVLALSQACGGDGCGWTPAIASVAVGEAVGLAIGVDAVGGRGRLAPVTLASVGVTALAATIVLERH